MQFSGLFLAMRKRLYFHILVIVTYTLAFKGQYEYGKVNNFPYTDFFITSGQNLNMSILETHSCRPQTSRCCECTQDCVQKRSCCIDKEWTHFNGSLHSYMDWKIEKASPFMNLECKPLLPGTNVMDSTHYMMIFSCPPVSNSIKNSETVRCQSDGFSLPVLASDGRMYKNEFCAKCNGETNYTMLGLIITCNTTRDNFIQQNINVSYKNCTIRLNKEARSLASTKGISYCTYPTNYGRNCHPSNPFYNLCNAYMAYYNGFANPHCMKCANYTPGINDSQACPIPSRGNAIFGPEWRFNYAMIISFDSKGCSPGSVWDIDLKRCTSFICRNKVSEEDAACRTSTTHETVRESTTDHNGITNSNRISSKKKKYNNTELFKKCLMKRGEISLIATKCQGSQKAAIKNSTTGVNDCTVDSHFMQLNQRKNNKQVYDYVGNSSLLFYQGLSTYCVRKKWFVESSCKYIEAISVKQQSENILHSNEWLHNFPNGELCFNHTKIPFRSIQNDLDELCSFRWKGKRYKYGEYILIHRFKSKENTRKDVVICNQYHLRRNCPMKELDMKSEYHFDGDGHGRNLISKKGGRTYSPSDYLPHEFGVRACITTDVQTGMGTQVVRYKRSELVKYYITVLGLPLSVLGYMSIIFVYSCFKELHNNFGFCLIWLCISLAASDTLMIVLATGQIDKKFQPHMAIALHWFFLNALSWITIISLELIGLLKNAYTTVNQNLSKRSFKNWILASFAPSLVIAIMVFLNHRNPSWVGYGQSLSMNLMTNQKALYATVLGPFVVTNLLSLGILIAIVVKLHLHRLSVKRSGITSSNGQRNVSIAKAALKLVVLFGVVELLGVIQTKEPVVDEVFSSFYVFLRSTRGILICLLYAFNFNVRRLLKNRMQSVFDSRRESALELN